MATFSPLMSPLVWDLGQIAAFEDLWLEQHHADRLGGVRAGPLEMGAPPHGFAYDRGDSKRPGDPTADGRRWTSARRLCLAIIAATLSTMGVAASPAYGHASFLEATPKPGARLAQSPERIVMTYTEPLNARLTSVRLLSSESARPLPSVARVTGGRRLELVPRTRLPRGAYRLDWRSVSTIDGHIREGSIGFGIGTASLGAPIELQQSLSPAGWVRAALRWLFYVALFFFAGGALNALLLARSGTLGSWLAPGGGSALAHDAAGAQDVVGRATRRTARAGAVAAVAAVIVTIFESADAAGGLDPARMRDFLFTGLAGYARMLTVAALVGAALAARRAVAPTALLTAVAMYGIALGGHAAAADPRALAVGTDWIHLLAAAVWAGGIAQLAWAWLPALRSGGADVRRSVIRTVLPRFGRVALPAFVIVAVTGSINALIELGALDALWRTGYGRVLAVKIVLVGAAAAVSYLHAFRLRERLIRVRPGEQMSGRIERAHRRALGCEAPLAAVVVAAAALLVAFPVPPREVRQVAAAYASASASARVVACKPCPLPKPTEEELAVGAPAGRLTVAAWLRKRGAGLDGTIRVLDRRRRPVDAAISVAAAPSPARCGKGCWRVRLAEQPDALTLVIVDSGKRHRVELPARWLSENNDRARRILGRVQRRMRALRTVRQVELGQSAGVKGPRARIDLELQAPDRMRYRSATVTGVIIGRRAWFRDARSLGWQEGSKGKEAFRMSDGFRWMVFAETVRLLGGGTKDGRRVAYLALVDWGYPVFYRFTVDLDRGYVLDRTLTTPENRIDESYSGFDAPLEIREPDAPPR